MYIKRRRAQSLCNPQSRRVFAKNETESASYLFYVISENIHAHTHAHIYRYRYTLVERRFAESYRLGLLLLALRSSVSSPFSFLPRPTSDLGEWNKFRVSEKLESLGGRRHFPWTSGKLLIPRHLLFNQGRVSTGADKMRRRWARLRSRWEVGSHLTFRL